MTQAGGPAAINGFLYQIIHHLGWLADVTLSGTLDDQGIENACLILEPRNGGDAQAETPSIFLVEQYKTRKNGTWSLSDIESVLVDLRKAVPSSYPANACYRFVTDGRAGRLDPLNAFLTNVKSADTPEDLDDTEEKTFRPGLSATNRQFFEHIVTVTQSAPPKSTEEKRATVFHLLSRFEIVFGADAKDRAIAVEQLLRPYAPDLGDECKIREHLVGVLVETLSKGEARLNTDDIDGMFVRVGLSPQRLRNRAALPETMSALTYRRLKRLRYKYERDVRTMLEWPSDKSVLVIAGASGAGKTWQLGRLLETYGQNRKVATLVSSAKTIEELMTCAARDVWQTGLGETSNKTLIAVSHFLRELTPDAPSPLFTVALDDVQDIDFASELAQQDWGDWGIRLVLTAPLAVARALQLRAKEAIHVHIVGEFTIDELETLLKHGGLRWTDLPPDLKKLLRNPILAGLFIELPYTSIQHAPRSEYEIFDSFWQRIAAKGRPGDEGIIMALAAHVHENKPYPLPRPMWRDVGLDNEQAAMRLEAAGWLRISGSGEVAFAHDRLLNWAVAKSLVQQLHNKNLPINSLEGILAGDVKETVQNVHRRLGYVPMDVLWLLAADNQNTETLGQLVAKMEKGHNFGSYGKELYINLLPTLGQRAVPILLNRLNAATGDSDHDYRTGLIGKAFAILALQENIELEDVINLFVHTSSRNQQAVAITILTAQPDTRHLDRLWQLHQQRLEALENKTNNSRHADYRASFAALRAGIAQNPDWLRNRILTADTEKEPASELGYMLNGLEHTSAPEIWNETGEALMAKVPNNKSRSLLKCIARFADRDKLDFVIQHLSQSEDFASGAALAALSVLDPQEAIRQLVQIKNSERYITRDQWLPVLLHSEPELTRQRIIELAESDPQGRRLIEMLFAERPDEMNEPMLCFLLSTLEQDLHKHLDNAVEPDPFWLHRPLSLLGRIARPELLAHLEAEAGGNLERMIVTVACSRLQINSNCRDILLESARRVLILICGKGIASLIKRELESKHFWVRHGGLNWSFILPDDGIIEKLANIASRPIPCDANGKPESDSYMEFRQAITALAGLGADAALVDILQRNNVTSVPDDLAWLRAHCGSMPKALTNQALLTLQDSTQAESALLTALIVARLSDDADLISAVRTVLEQAAPDGQVAACACIALQALGDTSEEFASLAQNLLHTVSNFRYGINALLHVGNSHPITDNGVI